MTATATHVTSWLMKLLEVDPLLDAPDPRLPGGVGIITHICRQFDRWLASPRARDFPDTVQGLHSWLRVNAPRFEECPMLFLYTNTLTARPYAGTLFPYFYIDHHRRIYLRVYLALHRRFYCGTDFEPPEVFTVDDFRLVLETMDFFRRQQASERSEGGPPRTPRAVSMPLPELVRCGVADARITSVTFGRGPVVAKTEPWPRALTISIDHHDPPIRARVLQATMLAMKRNGIAWPGTSGIPLPETRISLLRHLGERTAPTPSVTIYCRDIVQLSETMRAITLPESTTSLSLVVRITGRVALTRCLAETLGSARFRHVETLHIRTNIGLKRASRLTRLREHVRRERARYVEEWYRDACSAIPGLQRLPWHFHTISSRLKGYACPFAPELDIHWKDGAVFPNERASPGA
jgi:hypothetical protein